MDDQRGDGHRDERHKIQPRSKLRINAESDHQKRDQKSSPAEPHTSEDAARDPRKEQKERRFGRHRRTVRTPA